VDGTHIYWTDEDTQAIGRATLTASDGQPSWAATAGTADGLAVRAGVVYWSVPSTGRIYSRPVAGSTTIQRVDTGGQQPQGLAVDDTHIYWADSLNSRIGRAGLYGSHVTPSFINTLGDGPVGVAVDNPSPSIFGFSLSKRRFRPAGRTHPGGTTFRFGLAEPARVRITIDQLAPGRRARGRCRRPTRALRNHRRCTRRLRKTTITRSVREGLNSVNFNGRVGRHALKPGSYEATLFASVPGAPVSRTRPARFVVTR
jgi:hypothetical protein